MPAKRLRRVEAKPGQLKAAWGIDETDGRGIVYAFGAGGAQKGDGFMLAEAFERTKLPWGKTLVEELRDRGYDLATLKFTIEVKA